MTITERSSREDAPLRGDAGRVDPRRSYEPTSAWLHRQWRRWRVLIGVAALVIALGVGYGLATSGTSALRLDPASTRPDGAHALATLLEQRGVRVERAESFDDLLTALRQGPATTVLATTTDNLDRNRAERLREALRDANAGLVLAEPRDGPALRTLAPGVHWAGTGFTEVRQPDCGWSGARKAGDIRTSGAFYRAPSDRFQTCYSDGTRDALIHSERISVLGTSDALGNEELDQRGNAALGMNLLGARERLLVYVPSVADVPADQRPSVTSLLPPQVTAAVGVLGVAVVLAALTAARRLGPVVTEPLPVRVAAAETTVGHARLYRRAHAREPAAEALRQAARRRIARRLGLPPAESETGLVAAIAERTGRPESAVAEILAGGVPSDDTHLVELADALDRLEQEVSRS